MTTTEPTPAAPAAGRRRARRPDSILIYGQQKTGTTGMYNTVKDALAPMAEDYFFLFEPTTAAQIRTIRRADPHLGIMAKVVAHRVRHKFPIDSFQRRVMMVRDPRDALISNLLFKPLIRSTVGLDMQRHEKFLAALERKEGDPGSISVQELLELGVSVGYKHSTESRMGAMQASLVEVKEAHDFHLLGYERFVDGDLADTADYLGLDLRVREPERGTWLDHISRSREYGAWRHWFTPRDVDFYRPVFQDFLDHFGYGGEWELAEPQSIDPATSSRHVRASLAKRRAELNRGDTDADGRGASFDLWTQFSMADDGSITAAVAVAEHLHSLGKGYSQSARYWAHRAALQGSIAGVVLRDEIDRTNPARRPRPPGSGSARTSSDE